MNSEFSQNIRRGDLWKRLLFVILFSIIYGVAEIVVYTITFFQFGFVLFTSERNEKLLEFSQSLSSYVYHLLRYIQFNSDEKPFPFSTWPAPD